MSLGLRPGTAGQAEVTSSCFWSPVLWADVHRYAIVSPELSQDNSSVFSDLLFIDDDINLEYKRLFKN